MAYVLMHFLETAMMSFVEILMINCFQFNT